MMVPMILFLGTIFLHFYLYPSDRRLNNTKYLVFKCLPIVALIGLVLASVDATSTTKTNTTVDSILGTNSYGNLVIIGLIFSCIGDALLVYDNALLCGAMSFSVAQISYALAFGVGAIYSWLVVGGFVTIFGICTLVLRQLRSIMVCLLYLTLLFHSCGRAFYQFIIEDLNWKASCATIGIVLFLSSDIILVSAAFGKMKNSKNLIMGTYYAAQLAIALSTLNGDHLIPTKTFT
ncbi:hypothetical protein SNEBB_004017 [Seison nebaliae]|nr:hypothetical protein SNEBB_004017 [Seison nebaliae]